MKRGLAPMPFNGWNNASHLGLFLTSIHSSLVSSTASVIVDKNYLSEKYHFMHYKIDCVCDVEDALKSLMEYLDLKKLEEKKMFSLTFLHAFSDNKHIFLRIGCSLEKLLQISLTALIDATGLVHFFYIEGSAKNGTYNLKTHEKQIASLDVTNQRVRSESTNSDDSFIDVVSNTDSCFLKQAELLKLSKLPSGNDSELNSSLSSLTSLIQLTQNNASNFNGGGNNGSVPFKCLNGKANAVDYTHFQKDSTAAMSISNNRVQHHSSVKSKGRALLNHPPISRQQFYSAQIHSQRNGAAGGRTQQQPSILDKEFLEDKDYALANHFREQCARTACHFRSNANLYTKVDFSYRRDEYERLEKLVTHKNNDGSWCQRVSSDLDDTDEPIEMGKHHHLAFHDYCFASFKIAYCNNDKSKMKLCRASQPVVPCRTTLENSHSLLTPHADLLDACIAEHLQQPIDEVNNARAKHERKQQICPMKNPSQTCSATNVATPDLHLNSKCTSLLKENCKTDTPNPNQVSPSGYERERRRSHTLAQNLSHNRNNSKKLTNHQNHQERENEQASVKCAPINNLCDLDLESVARRVVEEEARKAARDNNRAGDDFVYFGDALRSKRWRQRPSINSSDTPGALSNEWMPGIDSAYLEARAKMEQPLHPSQKKAFFAKFNVSGLVDECVAPPSPIPTDVLIVGVSTQESRFLDDYLDVPNASVTNFLSTDDVTAFLGSVFVQDLDCENDRTIDTDSHHELLLPDMLGSNLLSPVPERNGSTSTSTSDSVHSFGSHDEKAFDTTLTDNPTSPADGRPEIITVSMFWNDLPGLMLDNQEFVRLVDIHKQVLPAKPTGLLKSRCLAMNLPFTSCTEIQRDFLIRYASADKSKSVLVVTKEVAKKLITYYVNPSKGTHSVSSNSAWTSRNSSKKSNLLGVEHRYFKYSARQPRIYDKSTCAEQKSAESGRRPLKRKSSFRTNRSDSVDRCEDSPSSISTQCTASTTDTSGYCSTEPGSTAGVGGGGNASGVGLTHVSNNSMVNVDELVVGQVEEPRRKRYKVSKRSLDEIAKERRQLKKRQKQLRKQELDLMKNTIRQIYTPSKAGGYPRWRESDTELVLLPSTEPPTRPHPPDMTAWERAAQVAGTTGSACVGRRGRRGGNCIDLIHFDQTGEISSTVNVAASCNTNHSSGFSNGGNNAVKRSGSQQAGRFYFHLYLSCHAACVQCYSCDLYFNLEEFALHLHGSGGQLATVNLAQRVELRSPYPSEMEARLWQRFVNMWRGYQTAGAPVAVPAASSATLTDNLNVSPTLVSATTIQHVTSVGMSAVDSHLCVDSR